MTNQDEGRTDFYSIQYARFGSALAAEIRREVFGEDIGQQGWRTAAEQAEIADFLRVGQVNLVLDVACGSGGPSLAFVERTGCRLTGVDREEVGIGYAQAQVLARGLSGRATFSVLDCEKPLPFEEGGFDAVMCIDAISHLRDRYETLRDWARLLRNGGRLVFTDVAVITGAITKSELDIRVASGPFVFVPPGINEDAIKAAGLTLLRLEDRTTAIVEIGTRMCSARARHAATLKQEEGADGFEKRQRLYATAAELAKSSRLSRFLYVAERS